MSNCTYYDLPDTLRGLYTDSFALQIIALNNDFPDVSTCIERDRVTMYRDRIGELHVAESADTEPCECIRHTLVVTRGRLCVVRWTIETVEDETDCEYREVHALLPLLNIMYTVLRELVIAEDVATQALHISYPGPEDVADVKRQQNEKHGSAGEGETGQSGDGGYITH